MNRLTVSMVAFVVAAPSTALAWEHLGHAWDYEEMPIQYYVSHPELPSYFPPIDPDLPVEDAYQVQIAKAGFSAWNDAACADITHEYVGDVENELDFTNFKKDGLNTITFDDPHNDLDEPGTIAANLTQSNRGEIARIIDGESFWKAEDSDIIFNNNITFWNNNEIRTGQCTSGSAMQATMTHEIGHLLGMAHSCEEDEICTDPLLLDATMFWTGGSCNAGRSTIKTDDIEGITALYGPFASFQCSHELEPGDSDTLAFGVVPFDLKCSVRSDAFEELTGADWEFGDGGTFSGVEDVHHTYEEPGNYTIRVCFNGARDSCGDWEFCFRRTGYVRACGIPDAEFTVAPVDGLTYSFLNETDISVYGCIFDIQWDIFAGTEATGEPIESISAWEPEFTFDEPGDYTVVLNVGGPAGTGAAKLTFNASRTAGASACSATGALGGTSAFLLALTGLVGLRRRRD